MCMLHVGINEEKSNTHAVTWSDPTTFFHKFAAHSLCESLGSVKLSGQMVATNKQLDKSDGIG